jgi:hemolysin activation/secretion protein
VKPISIPLLLLLVTGTAVAQLLPGIAPNPPEGAPVEALPPLNPSGQNQAGTGGVLCHKLCGIRLETPTDGTLQEIPNGVTVADELTLPSPVTLAAKLDRWIGHPLTQGDLVEIADTVLVHYDAEGYPVVGIDAPEQDLASGTLRLEVQIGRIGKVGVKKPNYGNPRSISKGLRLRGGDVLTREELDEQLSWFGRTVFRQPQLLVSPGYEPATADLLIVLAEKKPWNATLGFDTSGTEELGKERFTFGIAGITPNEHVIGWQTVLGSPVSSMEAHALGWEIPFQKIHQALQLDAVYAKVFTPSMNSGLPVENHGRSWSVGAMQKFFLPSLGKWRQRLAVGIEVKSTDQFLLFGGSQFTPGEVRLVNGRVNYGLGRNWDNGACTLDTSIIHAPGNLISGNDDADFHAYDPQANSDYLVWRAASSGWWSPGNDWRIALRGSAQLANSALLPVEQFAVGGYQTVRGVPERDFYADDGWEASLEIYTPAIVLKNLMQMRFLAFQDQGTLKDRGEDSTWVAGAGVGVRLSLTDHLDLRLDQGWRLDDHGSQTHFGLVVSF